MYLMSQVSLPECYRSLSPLDLTLSYASCIATPSTVELAKQSETSDQAGAVDFTSTRE